MVNSVGTRTRLSVEARRSQLLDVCLDLIGTRPWDAMTMADIAAAAGVHDCLLWCYRDIVAFRFENGGSDAGTLVAAMVFGDHI